MFEELELVLEAEAETEDDVGVDADAVMAAAVVEVVEVGVMLDLPTGKGWAEAAICAKTSNPEVSSKGEVNTIELTPLEEEEEGARGTGVPTVVPPAAVVLLSF